MVQGLIERYNFHGVIHFVAESHEDNSIKNPGVFIQTNVDGNYILIDVAYKHWTEKSFKPSYGYQNARFHHISTDEVYGTQGDQELFLKIPHTYQILHVVLVRQVLI